MPAPEMRSSWKSRVWAWRVAMAACVMLPVPVVAWLVVQHHLAVFAAGAIVTGCIMLAVLASMLAEKAQDRATLPDADRLILGRFRQSSLRLVVVAVALGCLIPPGMDVLKARLHVSAAEAFVAVSLPYWLVCGALRKWLGPVAGSDAETMRAHALMIDRDRRQFVWVYGAFTVMWALEIATWLPQARRALNGQRVDLGELHVFGIFAVSSLFMLYGPRRIFDAGVFAAMAEDESLTAFRDQAFRYGFFTLALGMIAIFDLALRNPRLAMVALPMLFAASQIAGFATLAIQECRAGRLGQSDDIAGGPDRVDFRGDAAAHGG